MKNKLILLSMVALLSGCSNNYEHNLTIIAPTGAPSLAFYNFASDSNFATTNNPASLVADYMAPANKDVVVAPTNVGVQAIVKQNVQYKIAATLTFGNLYVAATGNDDDGVMDKDDYIVVFQKKAVPGLVFKSVYGEELINAAHDVGDVSFAAQCLMSGKDVTSETKDAVDYVLIAEPAFTNVLSKKEAVKEYANLQTEYKTKFGVEIFQASLFVKNGVDASALLSTLEKDVDEVIKNGDLFTEKLSGLSEEQAQTLFGVVPKMAANVTKNNNRMGLGYKKAKENKEGIDKFLSLFGIDATSEEIYY